MFQKPETNEQKLAKLTAQAHQIKANIPNPVYLISRNPNQVEHTTREMASKSSGQLNQAQVLKANSILFKMGLDPEDLENKLSSLEVKRVDEQDHLDETDIEGFLYQKLFSSMLVAIEETQMKTIERTSEKFVQAMENDWKDMLDVIVHSIGTDLESAMRKDKAPQTTAVGGILERTDLTRSMGTVQIKKMEEYAKIINALNHFRKNNVPFGLVTKLSEVVSKRDTNRTFVDAWQLLKYIVGEKNVARDGTSDRPEMYFAVTDEKSKQSVCNDIVTGTLEFLQEQYKDIITRELKSKKSSGSIEIGGDPNLKSHILGYINLLYPNRSYPTYLELRGSGKDKYPIFAFIYFCLRVGQVNIALDAAKDESEICSMLRYFYREEGSVPSSLTISNLFQNTNDPYKNLILNIIGKKDPNKSYNAIPKWSLQDWIWFQLLLAWSQSKTSEKQQQQVSHLRNLQMQVEKYGPSYYNREGKTPFLYFQVLLMTQQFEAAIDYGLSECAQTHYTDIVHFAISLSYYGILNLHKSKYLYVRASESAPAAFNINLLLTQYTMFVANQEMLAFSVDYAVLIKDAHMRTQTLQQLVLETAAFSILFGEKVNEKLVPGILLNYLSLNEFKEVVNRVAHELQKQNRVIDACIALDLIDEFSEVYRILIFHLSKRLVPNPADHDNRRYLIDFTDQVVTQYTRSGEVEKIDKEKRLTVTILCSLISFYNLFYSEEYAEALKFMMKLDLIPFHQSHVDACVASFKTLDSTIQHNFPQIAIVVMQSLLNVKERIGNSSYVSYWSRQELRQYGKLLNQFVSRISTGNYMMPGDICATLAKLEVRLEY